jgi:D-3-phosphoglycerate dehydrogenase / 2-oxoglutarate reductase
MEIEATEEAVRFLRGQPLKSPVPSDEYDVQRQGLG